VGIPQGVDFEEKSRVFVVQFCRPGKLRREAIVFARDFEVPNNPRLTAQKNGLYAGFFNQKCCHFFIALRNRH